MIEQIDGTLDALESGTISRREAVARLGGLVLALTGGIGIAPAQERPATTFRATALNHIALRVQDLGRSRDFYREHLALDVLDESRWNCFMSCGDDHFVALFKGERSGLDHYCYTVDGYDPGAAVKKLEAAGLKHRRQENRVYFDDPDGLTVQISDLRGSRPG